eukprot:GEZU01016884.1.p1 GENE.GEZU01016884.1~~GEZU01016884.1.p1  ORF type:complete len:274 (-),score=52.09 GEZU01016884.1:524-1345(-)
MTSRKLQVAITSDIDRTLKKVAEGIETFDEIWNKVYTASNQTQKEKYEGELKKEIKKLQRMREQIKSWISSNDIKDKKNLIEARKEIERKMEMFKVCEKETKTKAYSKEGLAQPTKRDPEEAAKEELREWIGKCLDQFQEQIDAFEADTEAIQSKGKKAGAKDRERLEHLEKWAEKHKHHTNRLEQVLRLLDNGEITVDQVNSIKDSIEYYLESNQEPDFMEDEFMYDGVLPENIDDMGLSDSSDIEDDDDMGDSEKSDGIAHFFLVDDAFIY